MNKRIRMGINIGGPTIITIFVTLCLATLGTLSYVTANADMKLTGKTAASVIEYYQADSAGEEFLAVADAAIKSAIEDPGQGSVSDTVLANLSAIPGTEARKTDDGTVKAVYHTDINENRELYIEIAFDQALDPANERYGILSWKTLNNNYWNYEDYDIEFEDVIIP